MNKGEERVGERRGEDSDANQRRRDKKPAAVAFGGAAPYHIDKQATAIVTKLILTSPFSQFSGTNIQIWHYPKQFQTILEIRRIQYPSQLTFIPFIVKF